MEASHSYLESFMVFKEYTDLMGSEYHLLCMAKNHILHFSSFDALRMNHIFISQCSVCYAFEPTLVVIIYLSDEHICGSTNKLADSVPYSRIFQKISMTFKPPTHRPRLSGNGFLWVLGIIWLHTPYAQILVVQDPTSIARLIPFALVCVIG